MASSIPIFTMCDRKYTTLTLQNGRQCTNYNRLLACLYDVGCKALLDASVNTFALLQSGSHVGMYALGIGNKRICKCTMWLTGGWLTGAQQVSK